MSWFDDYVTRVYNIRRIIAILKRQPRSSLALVFAFALIALVQWLLGQGELLEKLPLLKESPVLGYPLAAICFGWAVWRIWKEAQPPALPGDRDRPNAIKGPLPFGPDDAELFCRLGRERDLAELLGRVNDPQQGLIVISGESGAGKTSLLRAGLVASLKAKGHKVTYWEATPRDPFSGLAHALGSPQMLTPQALYNALKQEDHCVILDQFEQMDAGTHPQIFAFLKRVLVAKPPHPFTVVVGFRREYTADWIDETGDFTNRLSLKNFQPNQAMDVMAVLAEAAQFTIHEDLLADLLRTTSDKNERIPPVEIGIAMLVLCELADSLPQREVRLKDYRFAGMSAGLLTDYLRARFEELPEEDHGELLKALLRLIETDSQKRLANGLPLAALHRGVNLPLARLQRYLDLFASRQVRALEIIEFEGVRHYRLPHERMVPALRRLSGQLLAEEAKLLDDFNAAFRAWRQNPRSRYLLSSGELRRLGRYWHDLSLGENRTQKQKYYQKSLQRRLLWRCNSILMTVAVVWLIGLGYQEYKAEMFKERISSWDLPGDLYERQSQLETLILDADVRDLSWMKGFQNELVIESGRLNTIQDFVSGRLRTLKLRLRGSRISSLAGLDKLTQLQSLQIRLNASLLATLEKITLPVSVQTLNIFGEGRIDDLTFLTHNATLTQLTLKNTVVASLQGMPISVKKLTLDLNQ